MERRGYSDRKGPRRGRRDGPPRGPGGGRPRGPGGDRPRGPQRSGEERLSRFLAFILRHHPEQVNLTLDDQGSADLDAVVEAIRSRPGFDSVDREQIERLVSTPAAAQRFEILGSRIRARYGHTLTQAVQYEAATPPEFLFHGTTPENAEQVMREGLHAAERQRVHLSADTPAAREVGRRRCPEPVILRIDTVCALKGGTKFYRGGPAVWLSDDVPAACITRVE